MAAVRRGYDGSIEPVAAAIDVTAAVAALALALRRSDSCPFACLSGVTLVVTTTFCLAAYGANTWALLVGAVCAAAIFAVWFATVLIERRSDGGDDGGGGPPRGRGPRPEPPPPSYDEPWWWGDFERQLRAYERRAQRGAIR